MTAEERNRERVYALGRQGQMPFLTTAKQLLLASIPRVYRNDAPLHRLCKGCGKKKPTEDFRPNGVYKGRPQVHQPCRECIEAQRVLEAPPPVPKEPGSVRVCIACGTEKPITEYNKHGRLTDGTIRRDMTCRTCDSKRRRAKHAAKT